MKTIRHYDLDSLLRDIKREQSEISEPWYERLARRIERMPKDTGAKFWLGYLSLLGLLIWVMA